VAGWSEGDKLSSGPIKLADFSYLAEELLVAGSPGTNVLAVLTRVDVKALLVLRTI